MTNRAVVHGLHLTGSSTTHAKIYGLKLTGSSTKKAKVYGLKITGGGVSKKAKVYGLRLNNGFTAGGNPLRAKVYGLGLLAGTPVANAGGGQIVEPLTMVTITALGATGIGTYSWAQVSNEAPTVTLIPTGPSVQFTAPARAAGCDVVIRLTVTAGASTLTDDATISVRPQLSWVAVNGVWVPRLDHPTA